MGPLYHYPISLSSATSDCPVRLTPLLYVSPFRSKLDDRPVPLGVVIGCAVGGVLLLGAIIAGVLFKTGCLKSCTCCGGSKPAVAAGTQNAVPAPDSAPSAPPPAYESPARGPSAVDQEYNAAGAPCASTHLPPPPADPSAPPPPFDEPRSASAPTGTVHCDAMETPAATGSPPPPPAFSDNQNTLPPAYQG